MSYRKIILILCLGMFLAGEKNVYAQAVSTTYSYTGSLQSWTVPNCVSTITIVANGAQGGNNGGDGASITGTFTVTPGHVIDMVVGQVGFVGDGGQNGGGGGGSYVWDATTTTLLVAAGGGGGLSTNGGSPAGAGSATTTPTVGGGSGCGAGGVNGNGGTYGAGNQSYAVGGGGAGWLSNGGTSPLTYSEGEGQGGFYPLSAVTPAAGGAGGCCTSAAGGYGGGGGSSGGSGASGGGGGYNGGGGGNPWSPWGSGGGGGSYNGGTNQTNVGATHTGNGTVVITSNTGLTLSMVVLNNDSCRNQSNGRARVVINGGSPPFTYSWSPVGGTGDTGTGLPQGTYTVTVSATCGTASAAVTINQPNILAASTTINAEVQCNGGSNGSITGNALGGASPYTYSWAPTGGTKATASALSAGTYTVSISDYCGESATAKATLTQPAVFSAITAATVTNVKCNGTSTGSASVTSMTGGGTPYTYKWSPGNQTAATASNLSAGTYTVTVVDGCSATETASVTITQPATAVAVTAVVNTNITCNGGNQGSITSTPSGGTSPYTYQWSPSGGNSATANTLTAGTYTVTVTDNNGCTATVSATVTQPAVLSVSLSATNVRCRGGSTGSATATVSGGTSPYTYQWSPSGGNAATANNLSAGTYSVTVQDNRGCTSIVSITITQPAALAMSASVTAEVACNGGSGGAASTTVSGGTAAYTYSWAPSGGSAATAAGLSAGIYTVTIMDNCGASVSSAVTITQPNVLKIPAYTLTNVSCNGGKNAVVIDTAKGGTSPYTYAWTPVGATTQSVSNLSAGTYTVSVKDAQGCSSTTSTVVTQPNVLIVNASATANVLCNGENDGSAGQKTVGGTGPYKYAWSPAAGTQDTATGLLAGIYTVITVDSHGCTASGTVTITQPQVLTVVTSVPTNETCFGQSKGQANSVVSGGTGPYIYSWSPTGQTTANATGLPVGTYIVGIQDKNGCTVSATATVTQPVHLSVAAGTVLNNLCYNVNIGTIVTYVNYATPPYKYTWTPNVSNGDTATGLSAGGYVVNIVDANGCTGSATSSISQPTQLNIQLDAVPDDGACSGSAWLTVTGGVSPYSYAWTDGNTTFMISNQCTGNYCCVVTDANGCIDNICTDLLSDAGVANINGGGVKINVYPNPTTGQFTMVTSGVNGESEVEVYDVLGAKVYSTTVNESKVINLGNEPDGIYLYRVISKAGGNLLGEGKIVLQK